MVPITQKNHSSSLPSHYPTVGGGSFIKCSCSDSSLIVLILSKATKIYLTGVFAFQVLYGYIDVDGYLFAPKKYNSVNFTQISIPTGTGHLPISFAIRDDFSKELHIERIQSRLREFVNDPRQVIQFVEENQPVAILLIRTTSDIASRFIQQQMPFNVFPQVGYTLGTNLYLANRLDEHNCMSNEEIELLKLRENEYRGILNKIFRDLDQKGKSIVFLAGNKGVGKSTLAKFLSNALNSANTEHNAKKVCRVFMLDTDVGHSELCPSGCISLHEIKRPLFGMSFVVSPLTTLANSCFFGSNNPSVDIGLFLKLTEKYLREFNDITSQEKSEDFVLIVNSLGWIEDLGYDLMLRMLGAIKPTILVNLEWTHGMLNFTIPANYRKITTTLRRSTGSLYLPQITTKLTSAQLRSFRIAAYLSQLFLRIERPFLNILRISDLPAYRVRFSTIAIYIHPELRFVEDKYMLCVLNCSFVALCTIETQFEKFFKRKHLLDNESFPTRLELRSDKLVPLDNVSRETGELSDTEDNDIDVLPVEQNMVPILRCVGFALIRAISNQRKLFYLITPVEHEILRQVNVFAYGHCLNTPDIIFDTNLYEAAPYLVELDSGLKETQKKFFSPLRTVTGAKRSFMARK